MEWISFGDKYIPVGEMMKKESTKQTRLVARVSEDIQQTVYKAAAYSGATVSQFIVDSVLDSANRVISQFETVKLTNDAATRMMALLDNPPEPNAYLQQAHACYKRTVQHETDQTGKAP